MFSVIETISTTILLLLLMMFFIHMLRGDAGEWLYAKFRINDGSVTKAVGEKQ